MSELTSGRPPGPDEPREPHQGVPTSPMEIITSRVEALTTEAVLLRKELKGTKDALTTETEKRQVATRRFVTTMAALGAALSVLIFLALINYSFITHVNDCIDPDDNPKSCYAQAQARQAGLVGIPPGQINTVTRYTFTCARTEVSDEAILACVEQKLAADARERATDR